MKAQMIEREGHREEESHLMPPESHIMVQRSHSPKTRLKRA
jgi:hypothetical protein